MSKRIALLGWGSLLWDSGTAFDAWHEPWCDDGPVLKIEFSRVSSSRGGALTLVIDPENGVPLRVAYCLSRRSSGAEAIEDLRAREGTTRRHIGWLHRGGGASYRDPESYRAILAWAVAKDIDCVVWTDLPTNFAEKVGRPFSVAAALAHLQALDTATRAAALDYIRRAPAFVQTPFRSALAAYAGAEINGVR